MQCGGGWEEERRGDQRPQSLCCKKEKEKGETVQRPGGSAKRNAFMGSLTVKKSETIQWPPSQLPPDHCMKSICPDVHTNAVIFYMCHNMNIQVEKHCY